jgi:hypothetical protein
VSCYATLTPKTETLCCIQDNHQFRQSVQISSIVCKPAETSCNFVFDFLITRGLETLFPTNEFVFSII